MSRPPDSSAMTRILHRKAGEGDHAEHAGGGTGASITETLFTTRAVGFHSDGGRPLHRLRRSPSPALRRRMTRLLIAALLAGPFAAPAFAEDAAPSGQVIYAASLKNLKDQTESLSEFKGKVAVIYFWATWCVPCRVEVPKLVALNTAYKAKGVAVVGIAVDSGDKVRAFTKEKGITYPIFYGNQDTTDLGKKLGNDVGGLPFMVVLDKSGKIVATFQGDIPDGKLESVLDPLVG